MRLYDRLLAETRPQKDAFLRLPLIREATAKGVSRGLYLAYLAEAYHHVKETCPLLGRALSRCDERDRVLREALIDYIAEERGHEAWILDDIDALGGRSATVLAAGPSPAVEVLIGYVAHAIDRHGPYAMLGMVHVLEGLSVDLAELAAGSIARTLAVDPSRGGFRYLTSHGAVDQAHVRFFADLLDKVDRREDQDRIIHTAAVVYGLFGAIFQGLAQRMEVDHAA